MNQSSAGRTQLRRAHAQSEVIDANLEHLQWLVSDGPTALQSELKTFEQSFKRYVATLAAACVERAPAQAASQTVPAKKPRHT